MAINDAYWPVEIERDGRYRIELNRWPREAEVPIAGGTPNVSHPFCEPLPEGKAYPVTHARLAVQAFDQTLDVKPDDRRAEFELRLSKGEARLRAWFQVQDAPSIGAYYVYVTWMGP